MSMSEFHSQMKAAGHRVISGHMYLVIDDGKLRDGVDEKDLPVERSRDFVAYIPKGRACRVYHGQTKEEIQEKIAGNAPDIEMQNRRKTK